MKKKEIVGLLGKGEIGSAMGRICEEAGYEVFVREIDYDDLKDKKIEYLHVSIPERDNKKFVKIVSDTINELKPKLTIINSSITPGTTRKIFNITKRPIVHSPVLGLHPNLYISIKKYFEKVVSPIDIKSKKLATKHFKELGLKTVFFRKPENSESAKLLDLVYFAWNIVFCKWMNEYSKDNNLDFDEVYTKQNQIYNKGYSKLLPNTLRPILIPMPGPISGHCTIPDTELIERFYPNRFTKFILKENKKYLGEVKNVKKQREDYLKIRNKIMKNEMA